MAYIWQRWLADALRAEGCQVKEHDGWKNRGRPASTGGFDPDGPGLHHTGSTASYDNPCPTLQTCIHGRSDLPGPLCQVVIGFDGKCHVIAAGRANHGGAHDGWGPYPSGDANESMIGFEIDYNGTQSPSKEQKDAATRAATAVLRKKNHDQGWAAIHKEWSTTGKWDTGQVGGDKWRSWIKDQLAGKGDEDEPYLQWPENSQKALVNDVVAAITNRDLYADDDERKVTVATALRRMNSAAGVTL